MNGKERADKQTSPSNATSDLALGAWNERWIMNEDAVKCRYCLAPQWPSNADDPMRHCPGCELSEARYPLRDLGAILCNLPGAIS